MCLKIRLDAIYLCQQFAFVVFVAGAVVSSYGEAVVGDVPGVLLFQHGPQVFVEGKAAHEAVAPFDVDVNVGEGFKRFWYGPGLFVVGVFEQFYPEAEAAYFHGIGIEVHAEKAAFDEGLFFVKECLLHSLAVAHAGAVGKEFVSEPPLYVKFVVGHFHAHGQAVAIAVAEDAEFAFDGQQFVEGRHEEVPGTYCGIANFEAVDEGVGLLKVGGAVFGVEVVAQVVEAVEVEVVKMAAVAEFLHHGAAEGFATNVHGDEAGRKKSAVLIAVDFFKNEAQHRCIDEGFVVFANTFGTFRREIVGIEEGEEVFQHRHRTGAAAAFVVFEHRAREKRQLEAVFHAVDADGFAFQAGDLKERAVEIGHPAEALAGIIGAFGGLFGQHLEEEFVDFVVVFDEAAVEEAVGGVAVVVLEQLRFQQFEKKNSVYPSDREF